MRKIATLMAVTALFLASCGQKGYTVTGTMQESVDGDTVFLATVGKEKLESADTAFVQNGTFTFTGVQDMPVNRYLIYKGMDDLRAYHQSFFLENGRISVQMERADGRGKVSGTTINNAYQKFNDDMMDIMAKQRETHNTPAETEEEKEAKDNALKELNDKMLLTLNNTITENITSPLGVQLLASYASYMDDAELEKALAQVPASFNDDERIVKLKKLLETIKSTAVGQKFVDFELKDPAGNPVKFSDYAGKHKVVLVDFWASWCPPCRRDMPMVVENYAAYKNKGLEIVGVSLDSDLEAWKKGIEALNITWPQMSDLNGWNSAAGQLYAVRLIPHMMLIDAEGTIIDRGFYANELNEKLSALLD